MAKNWAICIGVNGYDNLPDLKYPVRDAQLMRDFLLNEAGFDHVYLSRNHHSFLLWGNHNQ